jgi:Phosphotransferase enzyme family
MDAVDAALTVAREHGLRVDRPRVLHDLTNVIVHLEPAPVVARVARVFHDRERAARQVELANHAASLGAPVAAPSDLLPPGPHDLHGMIITFWRWYDHDRERALDAQTGGRTLRHLHDAFGSFEGELPPYADERELGTLLDRHEANGVHVDVLRRGLEEVTGARLSGQPVHGDAHLGNTLRTPDGRYWWVDLEGACRAPREYDLAASRWAEISWPDRSPFLHELLEGYGDYDAEVFDHMVVAYGLWNTVWTVELARLQPLPRVLAICNRRLGWWRERYAREM